jgi:LmbE family N-acetylglucosaminyl deacetylase
MKILAIGRKPIDLEFGCGGTLYKYHLKGHNIDLLILSETQKEKNGMNLRSEQEKSAEILGVRKILWGTEQQISSESGRTSFIENAISDIEPDMIFTYSDLDDDSENQKITSIVKDVSFSVKNILFYETQTSKDFNASVYVDITALIDKKMELLNTYSENTFLKGKKGIPLAELSKSVCGFRGMQITVKYAEGFHPYKLFINI